MNEWISEWMNKWMNKWVSEWINKWISEWMNEWMDGWMNEWMNWCTISLMGWVLSRWMYCTSTFQTYAGLVWKAKSKST